MRIPTRCTPRVFVLVVAPLAKNVQPTRVGGLEAVFRRGIGCGDPRLWSMRQFRKRPCLLCDAPYSIGSPGELFVQISLLN